MQGPQISTTPAALFARLGTAAAPVVVDVRRTAALAESDRLIVSAFHRPPEDVARWAYELPVGRPVVVYCVHGHEVGQNAAKALRAAGIDATYLEGGIAAWLEQSLPARRKIGTPGGKWVTRERPKIDRIACPWLVRRFIDPDAEFLYVPADTVKQVAVERDAVPYDVPDVRLDRKSTRLNSSHT